MLRLNRKICFITGAAQGIGLATAKSFIREGATVIMTDILDSLGQEEAEKLGPRALYFHLDVVQESQWKKIIAEIEKQVGPLDVMVNNAGISGQQCGWGSMDPEHMTLDAWDKVHLINSDGVFLGCKYAIRSMKKQGRGSIINVSSRSGMVGVPGSAAYASSKASVRNHSKSVALYCAQKDYSIRCNSVHPAAIMTSHWEAHLGQGQDRESNIKKMESQIPLKRLGSPEEVAEAIVFLASDECLFMTGAELVIDGGILAGSVSPSLESKD